MLLHNNPDLDPQALALKLEQISTHRRRVLPLFVKPEWLSLTPELAPEPDLIEQVTNSTSMRSFIKKIPVLGPFAIAAYGRARRIAAPGLAPKERIALLPVAGGLLVWINGIVRLNAVRQQIAHELLVLQNLHCEQVAHSTQLGRRIDQFDRVDIANRLERVEALDIGSRLDGFERIDASFRLERFEALDVAHRLSHFEALEVGTRLAALEQLNVLTEQMRLMRQQIGERDNRIAGLTQELRRYVSERISAGNAPMDALAPALGTTAALAAAPVAPTASAATAVTSASTANTDMESFYVEFEEQFRGAREDIASRLSVYLPYVSPAVAGSALRVVDVGCGRGEWIKLLSSQGIAATGIDLNQSMVDDCRAQGLSAECDDAITYLRRQPAGSVGAVTGFHIIEHLPFDTLIALFDAALHALHPAGVVVFETPNPENLLVGSCNFYYDPTHLRPVVPAVAQFMAVQRGFAHAEILRLHPYPQEVQVQEDTEIARRFNRAMYGAQDFAVVAWKTHAN